MLAVKNRFLTFQSAAATAATLALPAGVTPVQQILTNSGNYLNIKWIIDKLFDLQMIVIFYISCETFKNQKGVL